MAEVDVTWEASRRLTADERRLLLLLILFGPARRRDVKPEQRHRVDAGEDTTAQGTDSTDSGPASAESLEPT